MESMDDTVADAGNAGDDNIVARSKSDPIPVDLERFTAKIGVTSWDLTQYHYGAAQRIVIVFIIVVVGFGFKIFVLYGEILI